MKKRFLCAAFISSLLVGCTINQTVRPVSSFDAKEICVVVNPAVSQPGFLMAYTRSLSQKGFSVRQLAPNATVTECPITSTYTANWRWDLALYMAYADIKIYNNGNLIGHALYDAKSGGANMNKFIKGEEKIAELVDQLFPARTKVTTEMAK